MWERAGLARAIDQLRTRDVLTVWKLNRLGCSMKDLIEQMERVKELGAQFVSLQEGIDTTTAGGKLTFPVFGTLTEFERDLVRQRTMAGLRAAKERGRTGGWPRAVKEEDIPMLCRLMKELKASVRQICKAYGISKATLYRYVSPEGEQRK